MRHVARCATGNAPVTCNPLKRLVPRLCPGALPRSAQVTCKPLISLVPRFCPGLPHCVPHTPHTGDARLRAARTRNEVGFVGLRIGRVTGPQGSSGARLTRPLCEPVDQAARVGRGGVHLLRAYGRFRPLQRRGSNLIDGWAWLVIRNWLAGITSHQLGSATTRLQPRALPLAPSSRQSFQLAQRLIRDVLHRRLGGLIGRLVGHSSFSNGGPDVGSDWLTKRSTRVPLRTEASRSHAVSLAKTLSDHGKSVVCPVTKVSLQIPFERTGMHRRTEP